MARANILMVDDEPDIVELVNYNLGKDNYDVLSVTSGEEALVKIHTSPPDLIILDLMLPKMNGMEVCAALKQDPQYRQIPIIIFTAQGREMDEKLCREIGADAYITKAQQSKALIEQIDILLTRILAKRAQDGS